MSGDATVKPASWQALLWIAVFLFGLAATLWLNARALPVGQTLGVGPSAALRLVAVLLVALAVAHVWAALRARARAKPDASEYEQANAVPIIMVVAGLVGMIVILELGGGFVPAATSLFVLTARAFGKPIALPSLALGGALSLAAYAFFSQVLSLSLPSGPLERLLMG